MDDGEDDVFLRDGLVGKEQDIMMCLGGTNDQVNLWELRQLAISWGGLVSPQYRKFAWPKLVDAHQHVLRQRGSQERQHHIEVVASDMDLLRKELPRTCWQVQDYVSRQKKNKKRGKRVHFIPGVLSNTPIPEANSEDGSDHTPVPTIPQEGGTTIESTDIPGSINSQERKIIFNTIVNFLRTNPADDPCFEDDRYRYFSGLNNLTAVMLINMQSPSLTSLVLGKLGEWHLRDAARETTLETLLDIVFFPLLREMDAAVASHVCCVKPTFCLSWIRCLFTQQVRNIRVASRLLDFFFVSHAIMPLYFCAALLLHNKRHILDTPRANLENTLAALPNVLTDNMVEEMIQTCITTISRTPPTKLFVKTNHMVSSIAMLRQPVPWSQSSWAPTDWALIQHLKSARTTTSREPEIQPNNKYGMALRAAGIKTKEPNKQPRVIILVVVVVMLLGGGAYWAMQPPNNKQQMRPHVPPPPKHVTMLDVQPPKRRVQPEQSKRRVQPEQPKRRVQPEQPKRRAQPEQPKRRIEPEQPEQPKVVVQKTAQKMVRGTKLLREKAVTKVVMMMAAVSPPTLVSRAQTPVSKMASTVVASDDLSTVVASKPDEINLPVVKHIHRVTKHVAKHVARIMKGSFHFMKRLFRRQRKKE